MNGRLRVEAAEREPAGQGLRLSGVAVENTTEGIMITDPKLRILAVNKAFCEITGSAAAEVVGRLASVLRSGRHDQTFYEELWASILDRGRWEGEIWNRKNGAIYPELLSITVVHDEQGQVTNYVGVFSEGVETSDQLGFLRANGCDAYQGYLFAAALPPAGLAGLLRGVSSCA